MAGKPTYKELELRIKEAEKKALEQKQAAEAFTRKNAELNSFINNISFKYQIIFKNLELKFLPFLYIVKHIPNQHI